VLARPGEDGPSAKGSGQASGGRYLREIYVPDKEADEIFVITACPITGEKLKAYRRRKRRGKR
jgi:hypothetical protein